MDVRKGWGSQGRLPGGEGPAVLGRASWRSVTISGRLSEDAHLFLWAGCSANSGMGMNSLIFTVTQHYRNYWCPCLTHVETGAQLTKHANVEAPNNQGAGT